MTSPGSIFLCASVQRKIAYIILSIIWISGNISVMALPAAKDGDGTLAVSQTSVVAASESAQLGFRFSNANRGVYKTGSQFELTIPAAWPAPQATNSNGIGFIEMNAVSGSATAGVSAITGSGPWSVILNFEAAKGPDNGFGFNFKNLRAPSAAGTFTFAARTRQAGGAFTALNAQPVVTVIKAQANVELSNLVQIYDGTPRGVAVSTEPQGLAVAVTYNGATNAPVATGVYAVAVTVMDPGYDGAASGTLVVRDAENPAPEFGLETFDYLTYGGSSYESGSFLGQDGSSWNYSKVRGDSSIAGRSPTLEKAKGAFIRSGVIPGGVGQVSLKYRKAATQGVACGVYVNGALAGTISGGDGSIQSWTSGPVNVAGDVVLLLTNDVSSGAITVDDVAWTSYKAPATVTLGGLAQVYDGTPRTVNAATAPAGLTVAVSYAGRDVAPSNAGVYSVSATVVDDIYAGSATGVLVIAKADQHLDFPAVTGAVEMQTQALAASASSGLPVTYTAAGGPVWITNGSAVFAGTGGVSIAAAQAGDANWNPAATVVQTFNVLPMLELSTGPVNVRENGEGRLFVKLNHAPASTMTVTVARVSGDADIKIKKGAVLAMGTANWDWWQPVTLTASNDLDQASGTAGLRISLAGYAARQATAAELDDDVGENLALPVNGAAVAGGENPDWVHDGLHTDFAKYGHVVWTNVSSATMTMKLKGLSSISRIRLLNWDWLYPVFHRYRIDASADGTNWTLWVDATAQDHHGWEEWDVQGQPIRYLRFTGISNSANDLVCLSEWEVYGRRIPTPAEVRLLSLRQVYNGTPRPVGVVTVPPDLPVDIVYQEDTGSRRSVRQEGAAQTASNLPPVAAGTYLVTAEVANDDYTGMAAGTLVIERAGQTIDFPNPGSQSAMARPGLTATASSGLPVTFAVASGPAALDESGTRLVFSGTGTVHVIASQPGDPNWAPAPDVDISFDVYCPGVCLVLSQTNVNVREGGEGRFFIRLNKAPASPVVVQVDVLAGAGGVSIPSGVPLRFDPENWSAWQAVTAVADEDADSDGAQAVFRISIPDAVDQYVTATVLDDDIGENLALSSSGSTLAGTPGTAAQMPQLIDGVHTNDTGRGYTLWTNDPPGSATLDLKALATVSRIRLLNWDWNRQVQRYQVDGSADGANWTRLVDASGEDHAGWDDWMVTNQALRYLRLTGLSNSADGCVKWAELEVYGLRDMSPPKPVVWRPAVNVREGGEGRFFVRLDKAPERTVVLNISRRTGDTNLTIQSGAVRTFNKTCWDVWQAVTLAAPQDGNRDNETATFAVSTSNAPDQLVTATVLDDDIGENLALAAGGATASKIQGSQPGALLDGIQTVATNYGWTIWTNLAAPGSITVDLKATATVSRVRLLNWDWVFRVHRYRIETSVDGSTWSLLADASREDHAGWDDWPVADQAMRYVRFTGLSNSANQCVLVSELEVYGTRLTARKTMVATRSFDVPEPAMKTAMPEPMPVTVLTSDGVQDETGWAVVDGDETTAWTGIKAGGGYLVIEYKPALTLSALEVVMATGSLTNVQYLYSTDAINWQPLPKDLEDNPVSLNYLWLLFPGDGTAAVPQVLEVVPNP